MPTYNITKLANIETVGELALFANEAAASMLFGMMVIALFFIMLLVLKRYEFEKAFVTSSFVSFFLSLVLSYGGLVNFMFPLVFLLLTAFSTLYMYATNR